MSDEPEENPDASDEETEASASAEEGGAEEGGTGADAKKKKAPAKPAGPPPKCWFPSAHDHDLEALRGRLVQAGGPCTPDEVKVVPWGPKQVEGYVEVPAAKILAVCEWLRNDSHCRYDMLVCLSGMDYAKDDPQLAVIYHLLSVEQNRRAQIRTWVPRSDPTLDTVESVWPAANWHERETWDLMGIAFRGHSDLRRILCPEDWVGHPLRKDYEFPKEYHGISCV